MTDAPHPLQCHWFDIQTGVGSQNLAAIVQALNVQAPHVSQAWGMGAFVYHVQGSDPAKVPATAVKAYLLPNLDVADALGYHDLDPMGTPYIRVGVDIIKDNVAGDWVLGSADGVSAVCSHEACELAVDPSCESWGPTAPDGSSVAEESADPVEGYAYSLTVASKATGGTAAAVMVSDFVYPKWFGLPNPGNIGSLDVMARVTSAGALGAGGYKIVRAPDGSESEVFGDLRPTWKQESKIWPASRTARRVAQHPLAWVRMPGSPRG